MSARICGIPETSWLLGPHLAWLQWLGDSGFSRPLEGISFTYRLLAGMLMLLVFGVTCTAYTWREHYPSLFLVNCAATVVIVLQTLVGGAVVLSRLDLWTMGPSSCRVDGLALRVRHRCLPADLWKTRKPVRAEASQLIAQPSGVPGGD